MPSMYVIIAGVLHTNNWGADRETTPIISLSEYFDDCMRGVGSIAEFDRLLDDMVSEEFPMFPAHMKELAMVEVEKAKQRIRQQRVPTYVWRPSGKTARRKKKC